MSPCDTAHIARNEGLRGAVIAKYLALNKVPFLAFLFTTFPALRDRALQDPRFLFKLGVEVYGRVRCHPECSLIVDSFTRSLVHSFTRSHAPPPPMPPPPLSGRGPYDHFTSHHATHYDHFTRRKFHVLPGQFHAIHTIHTTPSSHHSHHPHTIQTTRPYGRKYFGWFSQTHHISTCHVMSYRPHLPATWR